MSGHKGKPLVWSRPIWSRLTLGLTTVMLAACSTATPRAPFSPRFAPHVPKVMVTCEQANRIAYSIIKDVGYTPTQLIIATPERQGLLEGTRLRQGGEDIARVRLTCTDDGVDVKSEYGGLAGFGAMNQRFPEYFYERFIATTEILYRHKPYIPPDSVQVTVTPLEGFDSQLEFGHIVTDVLPIRIEIANTTNEPYLLEAEQFVLLTAAGEQVQALQPSTTPFPVSPLSSQMLGPGARLTGYLYYPPGSYTGARGVLVEKSSQERSGFNVYFSSL